MSCFEGEHGVLFYQNVLTSTKTLITSGLWKEGNTKTLEKWTSYFTTDDEKTLCGLLLDSLIFRSRGQTKALLENIIEQSIPKVAQKNGCTITQNLYNEITQKLANRTDLIKIIPVIRDSDPPTKSGPLVARLYKREAGVNEKFMDWPWSVNNEIKNPNLVILIDDFVGTGEQFLKFFKKFIASPPQNNETTYIYAPLGACEEGIDKIQKELPFIHICCAETLQNDAKFFSGMEARYPGTTPEFRQKMRETYLTLLDTVGLGFLRKKFGYGDLELTYAYAHGTPNATLPIFWAATERFQPLFSR